MLALQECWDLGVREAGTPAGCTAGKEPDAVAESKPTEVSSLARTDLAADDIRATYSALQEMVSHQIQQSRHSPQFCLTCTNEGRQPGEACASSMSRSTRIGWQSVRAFRRGREAARKESGKERMSPMPQGETETESERARPQGAAHWPRR